MGRIAFRDRSYERQMERTYIADLQLAMNASSPNARCRRS